MAGLVVITRPYEDAQDYARELQRAGFATFVEPMLSIDPVPYSAPDLSQYDGVLLTSANAVEAYRHGSGDVDPLKEVFCVGKHTAAAARDAGFVDVFSVDGTGVDLFSHVLALPDVTQRRFLHMCGEHVAFPLVQKLKEAGINADSLVVYRACQVEEVSAEFRYVLTKGDVAAVTFFSKRTAEAFVSIFAETDSESLLEGINSLSISESVLECVRVLPWRASYVSKTPDRDGMLELLRTYVHKN